ncbi:uncharacterized protein LOC131936919 [Physella acuta]|uniref:uncharacterized protein LOC131936919 n=1 Tax=Physella acuta TaxID=109671 RepID=UPI0027DC96B3|nr:uncharacterized protein LOC131936919 [Physella acuta]
MDYCQFPPSLDTDNSSHDLNDYDPVDEMAEETADDQGFIDHEDADDTFDQLNHDREDHLAEVQDPRELMDLENVYDHLQFHAVTDQLVEVYVAGRDDDPDGPSAVLPDAVPVGSFKNLGGDFWRERYKPLHMKIDKTLVRGIDRIPEESVCYLDVERFRMFFTPYIDYRGEKETTDLEIHYRDSTNKTIVLRVHERVINSLSRYFQTLVFRGRFGGNKTFIDGIPPCNCELFEDIVTYAYTGNFVPRHDNVMNALFTAYQTNLHHLQMWCENFVIANLTVYTACHFLVLTDSLMLPTLKTGARKFIGAHLITISRSYAFVKLQPRHIMPLFEDDDLVILDPQTSYALKTRDREMVLFGAVLAHVSFRMSCDPFAAKLLKSCRMVDIGVENAWKMMNATYPHLRNHPTVRRYLKWAETLFAKVDVNLRKKIVIPSLWTFRRLLSDCEILDIMHIYAPHPTRPFVKNDKSRLIREGLEIEGFRIFVRRHASAYAIGGLSVRYRVSETGEYRSTNEIGFIDLREEENDKIFEMSLNKEEYVSEVIVGASDRMVHRLSFRTNTGRRFGPYGGYGEGSINYQERPPKARVTRLYDMECGCSIIDDRLYIANLALTWMNFN